MLFFAIAFAVAGYLHYKRLHPLYVVPAFVFAGVGFLFLLFSTDIIHLSLITVALWWFPLLCLPALVSCIIWAAKKLPGKPE
jgi:predicted MFS family arabinose efflux permease